MPLNLTVPLSEGETPASFTSRLASRNGRSAREFCLDWNLSFQDVVDGNQVAIGKVANLGGVAADALMAQAFVRVEGRSYLYRGQQIVRESLRRGRILVCSRCLASDIARKPELRPALAPYNRAVWLIEAIKTCPTHAVGLVELTHDLTPGRLHDFAFHASRALPRVKSSFGEAAQNQPSSLERYIVARLDRAADVRFLDILPLYAAIKTCEMIGVVAEFGRTPNLKHLTDDEWWHAGAAGFAIAAGGPDAITAFLAELQRTYPYGRSSLEGPQALFGRLYQWLAFGAEDPAYDHLRTLLAEYIGAHLPLGPGDIVFGRPVTLRILHSIQTLSKETGLHPKRLRKLLRAAGIIGDKQVALTDATAVFPAERASEVVRRARGALSLQKAGAYLNAPRVHIELLAKKGLIKPYMPARAFAAADQYALADLDEFVGRLLADARRVRKPKPGQMTIPTAAKRACCSAAEILNLILERKLSWVGHLASERGYLAVLVDLDEIREKTRGRETGGLTRRPASKRLRTTDRVVDALIKARHLRTFVTKDPVNRCPQVLISHDEIDRFCREYVSLFLLAEERGKHFRRVLKELDAQAIAPALRPDRIGARFYRRSAVQGKDELVP